MRAASSIVFVSREGFLNKWMRQIHRWLSIAFTMAVIGNVIAMVRQEQAVWIGLLALFPLILLMLTGLYLFARPYAVRWRAE
ncbi:hypothetical protein C2U70_11435 [Bradyrhizobium guangdongense]|nr:hypothetical protein [Bradyrhizobium guangdongense]TPQ37187.1 hypothetical protein C2U70_11435 [Bradyrhizobium guangdongense]